MESVSFFQISKAEKPEIEQRLGNLSEIAISTYLRGKYVLGPDDASVRTFYAVRKLLGMSERFFVVSDPEINAVMLPDGTAIYNSGTLNSLSQNIETLIALCKHEEIHFKKRHVSDIVSRMNASPMELLGSRRFHEYEAEFTAIMEMDKAGYNPLGYLQLLETVASLKNEKQETIEYDPDDWSAEWSDDMEPKDDPAEIDIDHGSTLDRITNVRDFFRQVQLRSLDKPLTPISFLNIDEIPPVSARDLLLIQKQNLETDLHASILSNDAEQVNNIVNDLYNLLQQISPSPEQRVNNMIWFTLSTSYKDVDEQYRLDVFDGKTIADYTAETFGNRENTRAYLVDLLSGALEEYIFYLTPLKIENHIEKLIDYLYRSNNSSFDQQDFINLCLEIVPLYQTYLENQSVESLAPTLQLGNSLYSRGVNNILQHHTVRTNLLIEFTNNFLDYFPLSMQTSILTNSRVNDMSTQKTLVAIYESKIIAFLAQVENPLTLIAISELLEVDYFGSKALNELLKNHSLQEISDMLVSWRKEISSSNWGNELNIAMQRYLDRLLEDLEQVGKRKSTHGSYTNRRVSILLDSDSQMSNTAQHWIDYTQHVRRFMQLYSSTDRKTKISLSASFADGAAFYLQNEITETVWENMLIRKKTLSLTELLSFVKELIRAPQELGVEWEITLDEIIAKLPDLVGVIKYKVLESLLKDDLRTQLDKYEELFSEYKLFGVVPQHPYSLIDNDDALSQLPEIDAKEQLDSLYRALHSAINNTDWDLNDPDDLRRLVSLGIISPNIRMQLQLTRAAITHQVKLAPDFATAMEILDKNGHLPWYIITDSYNYTSQNLAFYPAELEALEELANKYLKGVFSNRSGIGWMAIADVISESWFEESLELLIPLLNTSDNDRDLQMYIGEKWIAAEEFVTLGEVDKWSYMRDQNTQRQHVWLQQIPDEVLSQKSYGEMIEALYLSDNLMKYALLRKVLLSRKGVLRLPEKRSVLGAKFLDSHMDFPDGESREAMEKLLDGFLNHDDVIDIYLEIYPILMLMILQPPAQQISSLELAYDLSTNVLERLQSAKFATYKMPTDPEELHYHRTYIAFKLRNLMMHSKSLEKDVQTAASHEVPEVFNQLVNMELETLNLGATFTPWGLAVAVGENTPGGAKGLQLANLLFNPSDPADQKLLENIYDKVKGMDKVTVNKILRQAISESPEVAEAFDGLIGIGDNLGSGALFSVYELIYADGRKEAGIFRNINALYRTLTALSYYRKVLERLIAEHPDNSSYKVAHFLLRKNEEWIRSELYEPDYLEKNEIFRTQHHGYNLGLRNPFEIYIPEARYSGSIEIYRDESSRNTGFNPINLTQLKLAESTNLDQKEISHSDYKAVVSLLLNNFLYQINTGHLLFSDYTKGQFAIAENYVYVYDRKNLKYLAETDVMAIEQIIMNIGTGNTTGALTALLNYLLTFPQNIHLAVESDSLAKAINIEVSNLQTDWAKLLEILILAGVDLPETVLLTMKNLVFFQKLIVEAGFDNFAEALYCQHSNIDLDI